MTASVRILIVEDNRVDAKLVRYAIQSVPGWDVSLDVVEDGEQAIAYLQQEEGFATVEHPDLVVLDLNLPKRDGTEVLKAIRTNPDLKSMTVIVLSSSPMDVIYDKVRDADVQPNCCFTKPIGLDEFLALGETMHQCYLTGGNYAQGAGGS